MILKKTGLQGLIYSHPGAIYMYISIIFKQFYVKHLWNGGINVYINYLVHMTKMAAMPIYGKNPSKIFFSESGGQISKKLGMKHQWLKY